MTTKTSATQAFSEYAMQRLSETNPELVRRDTLAPAFGNATSEPISTKQETSRQPEKTYFGISVVRTTEQKISFLQPRSQSIARPFQEYEREHVTYKDGPLESFSSRLRMLSERKLAQNHKAVRNEKKAS